MKGGRCKFCACTETRACRIGCAWINDERTICTTCEAFRDLTVAETKAIVVALGYDWALPYRFDGIVCAAAAIEALREAGYDLVRRVAFNFESMNVHSSRYRGGE